MCDESGKVWWRNWTLARMGLGVFKLRFIGAADANAVDTEVTFSAMVGNDTGSSESASMNQNERMVSLYSNSQM